MIGISESQNFQFKAAYTLAERPTTQTRRQKCQALPKTEKSTTASLRKQDRLSPRRDSPQERRIIPNAQKSAQGRGKGHWPGGAGHW